MAALQESTGEHACQHGGQHQQDDADEDEEAQVPRMDFHGPGSMTIR